MMMGGMTGMTTGAFTINGRGFDMNRVDIAARVGDVELWEIINPTGMDHPFHLHGTQFQVAERERAGVARPEPYLAWKDTVNVARGETVRFRVRQDLPGLRMYHCHILEHEDQGMMGVLKVS
jgi:bilirubin oxidase